MPDNKINIIISAKDLASNAFKQVQNSANAFAARTAANFATIKASVLSAQSAVAALGVGLAIRHEFTAFREIIDQMDELSKAATRTGQSVERLSELRFAGELSDTSMSDITTAFRVLNNQISEATNKGGQAAAAFEALGISVKELQTLSTDDVFLRVAESLATATDSADKYAVAQQVLGRGYQSLIPLIAGGAEGLRAAANEARFFGATVSTEAAAGAERLNDSITRIGLAIKGVRQELAVPMLNPVADVIEKFAYSIAGTRKELADLFNGYSEGMRAIADLVEGVYNAVSGTVKYITSAITLLPKLLVAKTFAALTEMEIMVREFVNNTPLLTAAWGDQSQELILLQSQLTSIHKTSLEWEAQTSRAFENMKSGLGDFGVSAVNMVEFIGAQYKRLYTVFKTYGDNIGAAFGSGFKLGTEGAAEAVNEITFATDKAKDSAESLARVWESSVRLSMDIAAGRARELQAIRNQFLKQSEDLRRDTLSKSAAGRKQLMDEEIAALNKLNSEKLFTEEEYQLRRQAIVFKYSGTAALRPQMNAELAELDKRNAEGLLKEEQYQAALAAIRAKYANMGQPGPRRESPEEEARRMREATMNGESFKDVIDASNYAVTDFAESLDVSRAAYDGLLSSANAARDGIANSIQGIISGERKLADSTKAMVGSVVKSLEAMISQMLAALALKWALGAAGFAIGGPVGGMVGSGLGGVVAGGGFDVGGPIGSAQRGSGLASMPARGNGLASLPMPMAGGSMRNMGGGEAQAPVQYITNNYIQAIDAPSFAKHLESQDSQRVLEKTGIVNAQRSMSYRNAHRTIR